MREAREPAIVRRMKAFITGGNAGIGFAIAEGLGRRGFDCTLACRDLEKGRVAAEELRRRTRSSVDVVRLDLTDLELVREVARTRDAVEVLVCNAAAWASSKKLTRAGRELTWATNVLGHHALIRAMVPRVSRIVIVASGLAHSLDMSDVEFEQRRYDGVAAYAQSKQANRMLARAYSKRWPEIPVSSVHPGFTRTGAFAKGGGWMGAVAGLGAALFGRSPARSAETAIWLASAEGASERSGLYFVDGRSEPCTLSTPQEDEALFELCDRMTQSE